MQIRYSRRSARTLPDETTAPRQKMITTPPPLETSSYWFDRPPECSVHVGTRGYFGSYPYWLKAINRRHVHFLFIHTKHQKVKTLFGREIVGVRDEVEI